MAFELPPIVKRAERVLLEIELAVRRFSRSHRYVTGTQLREGAMKVARLTHRAFRDRARQREWVSRLSFAIDDLKITMQLGQQLKAFASFPQFEGIARDVDELGRMCGGWLKQAHLNGQNAATSKRSSQRPETLSTRAAHEAIR